MMNWACIGFLLWKKSTIALFPISQIKCDCPKQRRPETNNRGQSRPVCVWYNFRVMRAWILLIILAGLLVAPMKPACWLTPQAFSMKLTAIDPCAQQIRAESQANKVSIHYAVALEPIALSVFQLPVSLVISSLRQTSLKAVVFQSALIPPPPR